MNNPIRNIEAAKNIKNIKKIGISEVDSNLYLFLFLMLNLMPLNISLIKNTNPYENGKKAIITPTINKNKSEISIYLMPVGSMVCGTIPNNTIFLSNPFRPLLFEYF